MTLLPNEIISQILDMLPKDSNDKSPVAMMIKGSKNNVSLTTFNNFGKFDIFHSWRFQSKTSP